MSEDREKLRQQLIAEAKEDYRQQLIAEAKAAYQQPEIPEDPSDDGKAGEAFQVGMQRGASFGTRPTVAGISAGLGAASSKLFDEGQGLGAAFDAGTSAFSEARQDEINHQKELEKNHPTASLLGNIGGSLVTAPVTAVKGVLGAAKLGGMTGLGEAIGTSDTLQDAAEKTIGGAVMGGVTQYGLDKVGQGLSMGGKYVGDKIKNSGIGQAIGEFVDQAKAKIGSTLSGLPEGDISTYAHHTDEVNKIIDGFGDNIPLAVDGVRQKMNNAVQNKKNQLNKVISDALDKGAETFKTYSTALNGGEKVAGDVFQDTVERSNKISVKGIVEQLEKVKGQFDDVLEDEKIKMVQSMIDKVKERAPTGEATLREAFKIQKYLQEKSRGAFLQEGKMFINDKGVARAAKAGYSAARELVNEASPEIARANKQLHLMHLLEERMNNNILKEGKTAASFLAGGSGANKVAERHLDQFGRLTGFDALKEAKKLSAADKFANPQFTPFGSTGLTATRLLTGAGLGAGAAKLMGEDTKTGAAIGAGLSSPFAVKTLINGKNIAGKMVDAVGNKAGQALTSGMTKSVVAQNMGRLGGKYAQVMKDAEARGPQASAVTSYLLQSKDPEFRKQLKGEDEE